MNNVLNFMSTRLKTSGTLCKVLMQCVMVVVLVSCQNDQDFTDDTVPESPKLSVREIGGTETFVKLAIDPNYVFEVVLNLAKGTKQTKIENMSGDVLAFSLNKESDFNNVLILDMEKDANDKDVEVLVYAKLKDAAFKNMNAAYLNPSITVSSDFGTGEYFYSDEPLEIYRSPIIFVHGLASDANTFTPMIARINASGLYDDNFILSADYAGTSMDSYIVNIGVVPAAIDNMMTTNKDVLIPMVNLVGHSMGGILGRLYLQSDSYKGDVASLITIDTPHYGSQGADLLINLADKNPDTFFAGFAEKGAFVDLQVDSDATLSLNSDNLNLNNVPSHCITASIDLTDVLDSVPGDDSEFVPYLIATLLDGLAVDIYQGKSDIVVSLDSQLGVADEKFTSHFDGKWHCNVHTSNESADRVISLLSEVSNPEIFTTAGFAAKTLTYNPILPEVKPIPESQITLRAKNVVYKPSTAVKSVVFLCLNEEGELRGIDRQTAAPYEYKIPSLVRKGTVVVLAFTGDGVILLSTPKAF